MEKRNIISHDKRMFFKYVKMISVADPVNAPPIFPLSILLQ